jgi:hypothetical protein
VQGAAGVLAALFLCTEVGTFTIISEYPLAFSKERTLSYGVAQFLYP